jgi:hypothetical protein
MRYVRERSLYSRSVERREDEMMMSRWDIIPRLVQRPLADLHVGGVRVLVTLAPQRRAICFLISVSPTVKATL